MLTNIRHKHNFSTTHHIYCRRAGFGLIDSGYIPHTHPYDITYIEIKSRKYVVYGLYDLKYTRIESMLEICSSHRECVYVVICLCVCVCWRCWASDVDIFDGAYQNLASSAPRQTPHTTQHIYKFQSILTYMGCIWGIYTHEVRSRVWGNSKRISTHPYTRYRHPLYASLICITLLPIKVSVASTSSVVLAVRFVCFCLCMAFVLRNILPWAAELRRRALPETPHTHTHNIHIILNAIGKCR